MIHLDTDVLIRIAALDQDVLDFIGGKLAQGEEIVVSSIVWYEFLVGPINQSEITFVLSFLARPPIAFDETLAGQTTKLFGEIGRVRTQKTSSMIAATALAYGGGIATGSVQDFQDFVAFGLELIKV